MLFTHNVFKGTMQAREIKDTSIGKDKSIIIFR